MNKLQLMKAYAVQILKETIQIKANEQGIKELTHKPIY